MSRARDRRASLLGVGGGVCLALAVALGLLALDVARSRGACRQATSTIGSAGEDGLWRADSSSRSASPSRCSASTTTSRCGEPCDPASRPPRRPDRLRVRPTSSRHSKRRPGAARCDRRRRRRREAAVARRGAARCPRVSRAWCRRRRTAARFSPLRSRTSARRSSSTPRTTTRSTTSSWPCQRARGIQLTEAAGGKNPSPGGKGSSGAGAGDPGSGYCGAPRASTFLTPLGALLALGAPRAARGVRPSCASAPAVRAALGLSEPRRRVLVATARRRSSLRRRRSALAATSRSSRWTSDRTRAHRCRGVRRPRRLALDARAAEPRSPSASSARRPRRTSFARVAPGCSGRDRLAHRPGAAPSLPERRRGGLPGDARALDRRSSGRRRARPFLTGRDLADALGALRGLRTSRRPRSAASSSS